MNLAEFLLARVEEDEAAAALANGRVAWLTFRNSDGSMRYTTVAHQRLNSAEWIADGHTVEPQGVDVFYDPARVLAECAAKRAIVQEYQTVTKFRRIAKGSTLCSHAYVLQQLAAVYSDHPDYQESWRP